MPTEFRHLARAVIVHGGRIVVCRIRGAHAFLPGGGVEVGEGARAALQRELLEEMGLRVDRDAPFLGVLETMFCDDATGVAHHEINHLFRVVAPGLDPDRPPRSLERHIEFLWADATPGGLQAAGVLPEALRAMVPAALRADRPLWVSTME